MVKGREPQPVTKMKRRNIFTTPEARPRGGGLD